MLLLSPQLLLFSLDDFAASITFSNNPTSDFFCGKIRFEANKRTPLRKLIFWNIAILHKNAIT